MDKRSLALLAAFGATAIYALNYTFAKDVMPTYIKPFGFILLRVIGATVLFWMISFTGPKEKIARGDWWRLIACSFFGMVANMLMFFKGLSLTTPINSSVIMTTTPILVLVLSAILIKEKITWLKISGIGIGIVGALTLILYGAEIHQDAANIKLGNLLTFFNATAYSIYLIMVKPLTKKYHAFTLMKWLFLISIFINLPFTISEFSEVEWLHLPLHAILKFAFVVVATTFFAYLFNIYALRQLKASTLSVFIYLQPLLATSFAITMGSDRLNLIKVVAALLVFLGVFLVTRRTKTALKSG